MCEVHFYKCQCGRRWQAKKKLASCESNDPDVKCAESLCMYVGNVRRPQKKECEACLDVRDMLEGMEDGNGGDGNLMLTGGMTGF